MSLTPRQAAFVDEYLIDLNATQAAIRAGYSAKTASEQAARLLVNVKVAAAVVEKMKEREVRTHITADRVLQEVARLAFFDIRKLYAEDGSPIPIHQLDEDTAAAVAGLDIIEEYVGAGEDRVFVGYTKKYKLNSKNDALTMAMRHLGMFNDTMNLNINSEIGSRLAKAEARLNGNK